MAVYTQISEKDFTEFLGNYNFDNGATFSGIKGGTSNSNYLVKLKTINTSLQFLKKELIRIIFHIF